MSAIQIYHPNRATAESCATRAIVVGLLVASATLIAILLVGSWRDLTSMRLIELLFVPIYLALAYATARWQRGALPIAAAVAVVFS